MEPEILIASEADAEAIHRIYAPAVRTTAASFELEPPDVEEMRRRITNCLPRHPWLVFIRDHDVLGYAYGSAYRPRAAYQWSVEVSVYVREDARRSGIARRLYGELLPLLAKHGYFNAFAVITLPNPASVGVHEAMGFLPCGVFRNVGFKLGRWHDVGWWQLQLQPHYQAPSPPLPFSA